MASSLLTMKALAMACLTANVAGKSDKCPDKQLWKRWEGQTSEWNITIGTSNRTYLLHIPEGFSKNENRVGVVFSYHDEHMDAHHQESISGFSDPRRSRKYIAVYPQATNGMWYAGRSRGGNSSRGSTLDSQDHLYTSAILNQMHDMKGLCLDSTQLYATGMGNGSSFIHHLNCQNNHDPPFQAFAGVGGIPKTLDISLENCSPAGMKPLLMIHGIGQRERTEFKNSNESAPFKLNEHSLAAAWALAGGFPDRSQPIISFAKPEGLNFNWTK